MLPPWRSSGIKSSNDELQQPLKKPVLSAHSRTSNPTRPYLSGTQVEPPSASHDKHGLSRGGPPCNEEAWRGSDGPNCRPSAGRNISTFDGNNAQPQQQQPPQSSRSIPTIDQGHSNIAQSQSPLLPFSQGSYGGPSTGYRAPRPQRLEGHHHPQGGSMKAEDGRRFAGHLHQKAEDEDLQGDMPHRGGRHFGLTPQQSRDLEPGSHHGGYSMADGVSRGAPSGSIGAVSGQPLMRRPSESTSQQHSDFQRLDNPNASNNLPGASYTTGPIPPYSLVDGAGGPPPSFSPSSSLHSAFREHLMSQGAPYNMPSNFTGEVISRRENEQPSSSSNSSASVPIDADSQKLYQLIRLLEGDGKSQLHNAQRRMNDATNPPDVRHPQPASSHHSNFLSHESAGGGRLWDREGNFSAPDPSGAEDGTQAILSALMATQNPSQHLVSALSQVLSQQQQQQLPSLPMTQGPHHLSLGTPNNFSSTSPPISNVIHGGGASNNSSSNVSSVLSTSHNIDSQQAISQNSRSSLPLSASQRGYRQPPLQDLRAHSSRPLGEDRFTSSTSNNRFATEQSSSFNPSHTFQHEEKSRPTNSRGFDARPAQHPAARSGSGLPPGREREGRSAYFNNTQPSEAASAMSTAPSYDAPLSFERNPNNKPDVTTAARTLLNFLNSNGGPSPQQRNPDPMQSMLQKLCQLAAEDDKAISSLVPGVSDMLHSHHAPQHAPPRSSGDAQRGRDWRRSRSGGQAVDEQRRRREPWGKDTAADDKRAEELRRNVHPSMQGPGWGGGEGAPRVGDWKRDTLYRRGGGLNSMSTPRRLASPPTDRLQESRAPHVKPSELSGPTNRDVERRGWSRQPSPVPAAAKATIPPSCRSRSRSFGRRGGGHPDRFNPRQGYYREPPSSRGFSRDELSSVPSTPDSAANRRIMATGPPGAHLSGRAPSPMSAATSVVGPAIGDVLRTAAGDFPDDRQRRSSRSLPRRRPLKRSRSPPFTVGGRTSLRRQSFERGARRMSAERVSTGHGSARRSNSRPLVRHVPPVSRYFSSRHEADYKGAFGRGMPLKRRRLSPTGQLPREAGRENALLKQYMSSSTVLPPAEQSLSADKQLQLSLLRDIRTTLMKSDLSSNVSGLQRRLMDCALWVPSMKTVMATGKVESTGVGWADAFASRRKFEEDGRFLKTAPHILPAEWTFPANFISDFPGYPKSRSTRVDNLMPKTWALKCVEAMRASWVKIHSYVSAVGLGSLADTCSPGAVITCLPNVCGASLHRALTNHYKAHRISVTRIFLALYPENGFCRGWGVAYFVNWNAAESFFAVPHFQWRGMCTRVRPFIAPHLLQLNSFLAHRPTPGGRTEVISWNKSFFQQFAISIDRPLLDMYVSLLKNGDCPYAIESYMPLVMMSSNRRLHLNAPLARPPPALLRLLHESLGSPQPPAIVPPPLFTSLEGNLVLDGASPLDATEISSSSKEELSTESESLTEAANSYSDKANLGSDGNASPSTVDNSAPSSVLSLSLGSDPGCASRTSIEEPHTSTDSFSAGLKTSVENPGSCDLEQSGRLTGVADAELSLVTTEATELQSSPDTTLAVESVEASGLGGGVTDPAAELEEMDTTTPRPSRTENDGNLDVSPSSSHRSGGMEMGDDAAMDLSDEEGATDSGRYSHKHRQIGRPEWPTVNYEGETFGLHTWRAESDTGVTTFFANEDHVALAVDLLFDFHRCHRNGHPWTFGLEADGVSESDLRTALTTAISLFDISSLNGAMEELPYLLSISHLPNAHYDQMRPEIFNVFSNLVGDTADGELWGPQCYRFAETGRLRGDGLLLLPSSAPAARFPATISCKNGREWDKSKAIVVEMEGRSSIVRRYFLDAKRVEFDLERIGAVCCKLFASFVHLLSNKTEALSLPTSGAGRVEPPTSFPVTHTLRQWASAFPSIETGEIAHLAPQPTSGDAQHSDMAKVAAEFTKNQAPMSAVHFINTYFFSLENFFRLPPFMSFLNVERLSDLQDNADAAIQRLAQAPQRTKVAVSKATRDRLQSVAGHVLPLIFDQTKSRAATVRDKIYKLIEDGGGDLTDIRETVKDATSVTAAIDVLTQYLEENFGGEHNRDSEPAKEVPAKRNSQAIQWLMFESDPDWQATVRLPYVKSVAAPMSPALLSVGSAPPCFELTGDVCCSAVGAKASCAVRVADYLLSVEEKMLSMVLEGRVAGGLLPPYETLAFVFEEPAETSVLKSSSAVGVPPHTTNSAATEHEPQTLQPVSPSWDLADASDTETGKTIGVCIKLPTEADVATEHWRPQALRRLQAEGRFRMVPLEFVSCPPKTRYDMHRAVQKHFRGDELRYRWALHDFLFEPKDEDALFAELASEGLLTSIPAKPKGFGDR